MPPTLTEDRAAALKAAQDVIDKAQADKRDLTDDELTTVEAKQAEVVTIDRKIKSADVVKGVLALASTEDTTDADDKPARTLGDHYVKHAKPRLGGFTKGERLSVSSPEFKAATDPQSSPTATSITSVNIPQIDRTIVQAFRRPPFLTDLLSAGTLTSPAITYFVEGAREGAFTTVAEGGAKPQIHYVDPTAVTDALKKIAGFIKLNDEMMEDFDFLVSEINTRLLYDLAIFEESQLLSGAGTGSTILGLLNRSGIQTETQAVAPDTAGDTLFRAMMKVQTATGLTADGIVLNPTDYQKLRLSKDANGQYFGGGFFQGQYGVGGVDWQLPVWGLRTVVTAGTAAGTALVGNFAQAATVYRKGGVRVESTNSDGTDFVSNKVTIRVEERVALAARVPAAFVKCTLL